MAYNPLTNYLNQNPGVQQSYAPPSNVGPTMATSGINASVVPPLPQQSNTPTWDRLRAMQQQPYNQTAYANQQATAQPTSQSIFGRLDQQRQDALANPAATMYGVNGDGGGRLNSPVPQQRMAQGVSNNYQNFLSQSPQGGGNFNLQSLLQALQQQRGGMGNGVGKGGQGVGKGGGISQGGIQGLGGYNPTNRHP